MTNRKTGRAYRREQSRKHFDRMVSYLSHRNNNEGWYIKRHDSGGIGYCDNTPAESYVHYVRKTGGKRCCRKWSHRKVRNTEAIANGGAYKKVSTRLYWAYLW